MFVVRKSHPGLSSVRSMVLYVLYRNPEHDTLHVLKEHDSCHLSRKCHATSDFIHLAVALTP
jgi:hypothetical protein